MKRSRVVAIAAAAPIRIALFLGVWVSLFAYAGRPILVTAAAGGVAPAVAWAGLLLLAALPLMPMLVDHTPLQWLGWLTAALFSLLLALVFIGDLVRLAWTAADWVTRGAAAPLPDPRLISFAILIAAVGLSFVGLVQARCPRVRRVEVDIDGLAPELDGYRIVQWSDLHVGPTIQRGFVQRLVERTNALEADAIAITGDLADGHADDLRDQIEPLRDLRARDGVFYVTGNHEYYWRASEWVEAVEALGITFLGNAHRLARPGIVFAGVTDPVGRGLHAPDLSRALAGAPHDATTVLLAHRPQMAEEARRAGVDLQLSGHTHGGQFFPFSLFIRWFQPIVAGLHRVGRLSLYVNRGTGYWGPPSRLGVGGEITVLELRRTKLPM